jgi:hypothetical protein
MQKEYWLVAMKYKIRQFDYNIALWELCIAQHVTYMINNTGIPAKRNKCDDFI